MASKRTHHDKLRAEVAHLRRRAAHHEGAQPEPRSGKPLLGQTLEPYRALAALTNDVLYSMDADGALTYVSPQAERYGLRPEEMVGRPFLDFVAPEDRESVLRDFRRTVSTGGEFPTLFRIRDKNGNPRWLEDLGRVQRDAHGEIAGVTGVLRDITGRAEIENTLREQERLLADSQRIAGVGSWVWDVPANHLRWSKETYRIFGVSPETFDLTPETVLGMVHPDDLERVTAALDKAMNECAAYDLDHRIERPDGEERIVREQGEFLCDDAGRPVRGIGVCQDVTERRRAERELRESETKYRGLFATIFDAVLVFDAETRLLLDANDAAVQTYGYPREEILGLRYDDLAADPAESQAEVRRALAGQPTRILLTHHLRKGGAAFPAEVSASVIPIGARRAVCAVVRDITRRLETWKRLEQSEAKYRQLVESANSIILRCRLDGTVTFVNRFGEEFFGYSREEIVGRNIVGTIVPPTDSAGRDLAAMAAGIAADPERYLVNENENMRKNGERVWVLWANRPVRDDEGRVVEVLSIGYDRTEQRRVEQALRDSEKRLRQLALKLTRAREQERRRIASGLHDEIGQLLAAARLKLALARRRGVAGEAEGTLREAEEVLGKASDEIRELTFELSSHSLYDLGLSAALEDLAEHMERRFGIPIVFDRGPCPPRAPESLRATLYHAARELLFNVAKHAKADRARVRLRADGSAIRLVVEDDGRGFDPLAAERSWTRHGGYGLFHIREQIHALGGTIQVESVPGDGTRVTIETPLPPEAPRDG